MKKFKRAVKNTLLFPFRITWKFTKGTGKVLGAVFEGIAEFFTGIDL